MKKILPLIMIWLVCFNGITLTNIRLTNVTILDKHYVVASWTEPNACTTAGTCTYQVTFFSNGWQYTDMDASTSSGTYTDSGTVISKMYDTAIMIGWPHGPQIRTNVYSTLVGQQSAASNNVCFTLDSSEIATVVTCTE